ncbi:MAG: type II toxin-antitoxin system HicA family toxin [Candidatus Methylumidiphilus sp.]
MTINAKHRKILEAVYLTPVNGNLEWRKIESLLIALGVQIIEGDGSRVTFILNGKRADFHRPHPGKEALRYRIKAIREFLEYAGIKP